MSTDMVNITGEMVVIMLKRPASSVITLFLAAALALPLAIPVFSAASLTNLTKSRTYENVFSDVQPDTWYSGYVAGVYESALADGSEGLFRPDEKITLAEAIKLAACLYKGYFTGSTWFAPAVPWYKPYVEYAQQKGIISGEYKDYNAPATRADFAVIIANALPPEALTPVNKIADGTIPDVSEGFSYGGAVYMLYRAGVLAGADSEGTFFPARTITRAEAAAVVSRMLDAELRVSLSLAKTLTPEELFREHSPAVFYIEIFDGDGDMVKTGSGFFLSESGIAVTNHHVITGAHTARITTTDGEQYDVLGIYDYDRKKDTALLQIDGSGFPYLDTADSGSLKTGATVYTIGSPLGLQNSFSRGIISGASRIIEGSEYIQTDAPISSGSSGGALLDTGGRVVGITRGAVSGGQSLNLAVPINHINTLSSETHVPLASILIEMEYYAKHYPVPDFGAYYGINQYKSEDKDSETTFSYLVSDMPKDTSEMIDGYVELLEQNLFILYGYFVINGYDFTAYYNAKNDIIVLIGVNKVGEKECITIEIM